MIIIGSFVPDLIVLYYDAVDETRVILTDADPAIPGSDYINANYIRVSVMWKFFCVCCKFRNDKFFYCDDAGLRNAVKTIEPNLSIKNL